MLTFFWFRKPFIAVNHERKAHFKLIFIMGAIHKPRGDRERKAANPHEGQGNYEQLKSECLYFHMGNVIKINFGTAS